jgi:hypothetical protein
MTNHASVRGAGHALDGYGRPPDVTALDPSLLAACGVYYIHIPARGVTSLVTTDIKSAGAIVLMAWL